MTVDDPTAEDSRIDDRTASDASLSASPGHFRGLESAAPAEAAAVAAAIGVHLQDRELSAAAASDRDKDAGWAGRRWEYADRLARSRGRGVRIPSDAPGDPWQAAGRTDRM